MRIAVSTNLFPPDVSGTASYSGDICSVLADLGHEVYLILPQRNETVSFRDFGITSDDRVLKLPSWRVPPTRIMLGFTQLRSTHWPTNTARVTRFLRDNKIEYVYQQSHAFDSAYHTRRACRKLGIPRAIAHHTNITHPSPFINRILRWSERNILGTVHLKRDDLWICPDFFTQGYCEDRFPRMQHTKVMYGVRPLPPCHDPAVLKRAADFRARHEPLIVSMGHVTGCRDRVDLIQAAASLRKRYPRIGVVVIGDTQVTYPIDAAKSCGMADAVTFLGKTPRGQIRPYLDIADIEAHWYIDSSTFGVATLEAMACGVCCLSNCPEDCYGPNLFKENVHYMRVRAGDIEDMARVLTDLFENPDKRRAVAKQGADFVRAALSWQQVGEDLINAFKQHAGRFQSEHSVRR